MGQHSRPRRDPYLPYFVQAQPSVREVAAPQTFWHSLQMVLHRGTQNFWTCIGQLLTLAALTAAAAILVRSTGSALATCLTAVFQVAAALSAPGVSPLVTGGGSALIGVAAGMAVTRRWDRSTKATGALPADDVPAGRQADDAPVTRSAA